MTLNSILRTGELGWTILVRLLVGLIVFLPEGIQKLAFPDVLGAGRFAKIGIPFPEIMGPFVGVVETVCGLLIILGLFTRLAAVPLIVIMIVALVSTNLPILLGHDVGMFHLGDIKRLRVLERHARGPRRPHDAARLRLSPDRRGRPLVAGRPSGAVAVCIAVAEPTPARA